MCFILVNGFGPVRHKNEPEGWIIWSDDYDSDLFANYPLDERTKEIAWDHVDICGNCDGCGSQGKNKRYLGESLRRFVSQCSGLTIRPQKKWNAQKASRAEKE